MRKILLGLFFCLQGLLATESMAASCASSSLASYFGLGSGGCTIGSYLFSDFKFLEQPTGAMAFSAISVNPFASAGSVGLDFAVDATAGPGELFENLISYRVTGIGSTLIGASLFFSGSGSSGDGVASVVENLCIAGLFLGMDGVSSCSGSAQNLIVVDVGGSPDPLVSLAFAAVGSLAVVTDLAIDGGPDGTAQLGSASNRFFAGAPAAAPEPGPIALLLAGLLAFAAFGRIRRLPQSQQQRLRS